MGSLSLTTALTLHHHSFTAFFPTSQTSRTSQFTIPELMLSHGLGTHRPCIEMEELVELGLSILI